MSKAEVALGTHPPCPVLSALYKSQRPSVQLVPNVHLSPVALACNGTSYKAMLAENWAAKTEDPLSATNSATAATPAFNPAAPEYNELARRVSMSSSMQRWNDLNVRVRQLEKQLPGLTGEAKESKQQQLDEAKQHLAEAQTALSDLQASFDPDPLSLVPWMSALFALADAGCSSFDAGGCGWPPQPDKTLLTELLAPSAATAATGGPAAVSAVLYGGAEKVLGVFKRRYETERGPGRVAVFTRLAVNCFGDDSPADLAAAVEAAVDKSRSNLLGPEGAAAGASLDLVQLHWLDYQERDFLPVLLALARLARSPTAAAAEDGAADQSRKVAAIGLVDPPAHAITAALRAGVPLACVTLPYNLLDTSAAPVLQQCRSQSVKVLASGALAHGLISEAYLGVAAPDTAGTAAAGAGSVVTGTAVEAIGPDNLSAGLAMVARYGGWGRFQQLLSCLKRVADKHNVSVEAVALRWLIDQGTFPVLSARWSASAGPWATFGHTYGLQHTAAATTPSAEPADGQPGDDQVARAGTEGDKAADAGIPGAPGPFVPGVDGALFQVASFLDADDVAALSDLCGAIH